MDYEERHITESINCTFVHSDVTVRKGFTLVEIVVVVLILMIGIIPIYDSMVQGSKRVRFNRRRNFAAAICNNTIEIYKKLHIKTLVAEKEDIKELVQPGSDNCEDTLLCPWKSTQIQDYMAKNEEFKKQVEDFQKEFALYEVKTRVNSSFTPPAGLEEKMCTFQVRVAYKDLKASGEPKLVASAMVFSDPTFPAGKAIK